MDCSPPGSSIHGILQARALEWGASGGTHKWSSAPTEGMGPPWRSGRERQGHLPSGSCALTAPGSGTEGPVCTDRWGEKGPHRACTARRRVGVEPERLRGADGKEACSLSEDLELLPECEEGSEKGWSRRVSCVDSSMGV